MTTGFGTKSATQSKIKVDVYGDDRKPEYIAAQQLKKIIEAGLSPTDEGVFSLHSSVTMFGQKRRDMDIFLFARFPKGLVRKLSLFRADDIRVEDDVAFFNIVCIIEVKDHTDKRVRFDDLSASVLYHLNYAHTPVI
jgi:hypothetical protein